MAVWLTCVHRADTFAACSGGVDEHAELTQAEHQFVKAVCSYCHCSHLCRLCLTASYPAWQLSSVQGHDAREPIGFDGSKTSHTSDVDDDDEASNDEFSSGGSGSDVSMDSADSAGSRDMLEQGQDGDEVCATHLARCRRRVCHLLSVCCSGGARKAVTSGCHHLWSCEFGRVGGNQPRNARAALLGASSAYTAACGCGRNPARVIPSDRRRLRDDERAVRGDMVPAVWATGTPPRACTPVMPPRLPPLPPLPRRFGSASAELDVRRLDPLAPLAAAVVRPFASVPAFARVPALARCGREARLLALPPGMMPMSASSFRTTSATRRLDTVGRSLRLRWRRTPPAKPARPRGADGGSVARAGSRHSQGLCAMGGGLSLSRSGRYSGGGGGRAGGCTLGDCAAALVSRSGGRTTAGPTTVVPWAGSCCLPRRLACGRCGDVTGDGGPPGVK